MSSDKQENRCIVICGPTASGKSSLAMKLATELNGEIVNADSMQVYNELKILTSRPSSTDMENIPHNLFGIRRIVEPCSVNIWINLTKNTISEIIDRGVQKLKNIRTPIKVYFIETVDGSEVAKKHKINKGQNNSKNLYPENFLT